MGALPKIGETLWYVAHRREEWLALLGFSAPALKCGARDRWIGWDFRTQYDRQHLLANNSRFLILPGRRVPNLGSRVLALCERRLAGDYSAVPAAPKLVFVRPLVRGARARLTRPELLPADRHGGPKAMIPADTMRSLPDFFADIDDPRRRQGRRHPLPVVLAIAAGATLCGARGYKAMAEWAEDLSPRARERFRCRHRGGRYEVPSEFVIRDVLVRVDPDQLDRALQRFHADHASPDDAIAIDGKTMRNAVYTRGRGRRRGARDERRCGARGRQDRREPVPGAHPRRRRPAQRRHPHPTKIDRLPVGADDETKRTPTASGRIEIGMVLPLLDDLELDFEGRTFTADALLTQRKLATFFRDRGAHFVFTAKANEPTLLDDIRLFFENRAEPDFRDPPRPRARRLESPIWTTDRLNGYLTFPHVGQAFLVERTATEEKSGKTSVEHAFGVTSHPPDTAEPPPTARAQPRPLEGRVRSQHPRQRLRRGPRLRIRTGRGPVQHHPAASLRHRPDQGQTRLRRRRHAPPRPPSPARVRLPAHDGRLAQAQKTRPARR